MRKILFAIGVLFLTISICSLTGCYDDIKTDSLPIIPETGNVEDLGAISVKVNGKADLGDDPRAYYSPQFRVGIEYCLNNAFDTTAFRVQIDGNKIIDKSFSVKLSALLPNTKYYYRTYITVSSGDAIDHFGETKSFKTKAMSPEDYYVDLNLPSKTLWASMNVGAETCVGPGDIFAWGETSQREGLYNWLTYTKLGNGYDEQRHLPILTKYCLSDEYGAVDSISALLDEDDAATVNWGPEWCTPSYKQIKELIDHCTWYWTSVNGQYGYLIASNRNDNAIFLPAAGEIGSAYQDSPDRWEVGWAGFYWSRNIENEQGYSGSAYILTFDKKDLYTAASYRCYGYTVRPVRKPSTQPQQE